MPPRPTFYDPIVQTEPPPAPELPPVRGVPIEAPGWYVFSDDVSAYLARLAEQFHGEGRAALLQAAAAFVASVEPEPEPEPPDAVESLPEPPGAPSWAPYSELVAGIARVEVYPDQDGKWHARPVDATGMILFVTDGSYDRGWVESEAAGRWPGVGIYEVPDAMGDSIWDEQHSVNDAEARSAYTGRRRPSPRRLFQ